MNVKLLTEPHWRFLSLKRGCTCSSESTLVKMPHCWKSHVMAHLRAFSDTYEHHDRENGDCISLQRKKYASISITREA